jgi:hypothetical protein
MAEFISSVKQDDYIDTYRKLKQTEQDIKIFNDEMSLIYKKQEQQVQKLATEIDHFTEDLKLQEMQLVKQEKM